MGLTGVLGRNVFSKSRSFVAGREQHHNGRGKRWSSVRSYLCGDELFGSVVAEEDSTSVKTFVSCRSSEATVTQPMLTDEQTTDHETVRLPTEEDLMKNVEEAAIRIQSAFRRYMTRVEKTQCNINEMSCTVEDSIDEGKESLYEETASVGTSLEVQTAHSVKIFSVMQKAKEQPLKFKEEWDDSMVSSNISKMRMQNRMEAMTRRERALAYAFSQQLRICSKKKVTKLDDEETTNMGWSWLERWMATRMPDQDTLHASKLNSKKPISPTNTNSFNFSKEAKESCGSNEVFLQFSSSFSIKSPMPVKTSQKKALKPKRNVSKRKTVPSYQFAKDYQLSK